MLSFQKQLTAASSLLSSSFLMSLITFFVGLISQSFNTCFIVDIILPQLFPEGIAQRAARHWEDEKCYQSTSLTKGSAQTWFPSHLCSLALSPPTPLPLLPASPWVILQAISLGGRSLVGRGDAKQ